MAQTVCVIPSRSKWAWLRGSLTRAIAFGTPKPSLAICEMIDVVLVVAGDREHESGRPRDPGALEYVDLGRVAVHDDHAELRLELLEPLTVLLDERHLVTHREQ